jgi:hypothetical protein
MIGPNKCLHCDLLLVPMAGRPAMPMRPIRQWPTGGKHTAIGDQPVPPTPREIATRLATLGAEMQDLGACMDYFGGFNARIAQHGAQMVAGGLVVQAWADSIIDEARAV